MYVLSVWVLLQAIVDWQKKYETVYVLKFRSNCYQMNTKLLGPGQMLHDIQ